MSKWLGRVKYIGGALRVVWLHSTTHLPNYSREVDLESKMGRLACQKALKYPEEKCFCLGFSCEREAAIFSRA